MHSRPTYPQRADTRPIFTAIPNCKGNDAFGAYAGGKGAKGARRFLKARHCFCAATLLLALAAIPLACTGPGLEPEQVVEPAKDPGETETGLQDEAREAEPDEVFDPIREFLLSGEVLSPSYAIGAGYPEFYYFSDIGTFAYQTHQYGVREEGQLISLRGKWSLEEDRLTLTILSETRAYGGEKTEDHFLGEVLSGYELIRIDDGYELSYRVTLEEDESGRPYLTWDGEPIYTHYIQEQDKETLRFMAYRGNGDPGLAALEERGNRAGNIINFCWIMKSDSRAFMTLLTVNPDKGYITPLYRVDTGEEGWFAESEWDQFLLLDDDASGINMHNGWIYYLNWDDNRSIYRIRPDGSERTRLNENSARYMSLVNNWIFYINQDDGDTIYRMRPDGSENTRIGSDAADYLSVSGGWAYYSNQDAGGAIFKIRTDGGESIRLNDHSSSKIVPERSRLFYRNNEDNFRIYKMRIDGSEITPLGEERVTTLNLTHEWVYFGLMDGNGIGRMRHDGSGQEILGADIEGLSMIGLINFAWDWIYFTNGEAFTFYHRIRHDGSGYERMY